MLRSMRRAFMVLASLLAVPAAASAQATIAGTVKDASGGVLPGVTVEASSPVLIEKSRSVVTDGTGQYKITQLRPGAYAVTFTLTGFNTVKREGIELAGEFTATVNAELKVGSLEETITVTGETPIVDVQSATKERVLTSDVVEAVPTSRVYASLAITIPGVTNGGVTQDVGGTTGGIMTNMLVHDSKQDSQRITQNGLSLAVNIGFRAPAAPNLGAFQELAVDTGAVDATTATGGVRINFIPRDGGNTFKGLGFFSFANSSMQSNNFGQDLKNLGLTTPNSVERLWDFNPGFGGPLKKDKLWFYGTLRQLGAYNYVGNTFSNANASNPNAWMYVADTNRPAVTQQIWADSQVRLTWQATPKNKLAVTYQQDDINGNPPFGCDCIMLARTANAPTSPEAATAYRFPLERLVQADWSSPLTNRLLLDGAIQSHTERYDTDDVGYLLQPPGSTMVSVTEQGGTFPGITYRAPAVYGNQWMWVLLYRASLSYVTGAHAFKVGFNNGRGHNDIATTLHVPYSYRFNNGVPNLITMRTPSLIPSEYNYDLGLYAQDKWTVNRLTFSYGLRFDAFGNTIPAQNLGPATLAPTRNYSFPEQSNLAFKDLTPHLSVIYDLFGTGKTAVRGSVNKYLAGLINFGTGLVSTPGTVNNVVASTTRAWTDSNGNFKPDCDLLNPNAQTVAGGDVCGRDANTAFGTLGPGAIWDPNLLTGWNHRGYNWEFSTGVQQEVLPRVSVDVGYYRRIYGDFQVSTNINTNASNFSAFSVTAPADPRLPNGGGYAISGLYDLNPAQFGQPAQLYNTLSDTYGSQIEHYNGVDMTVNARLRNGLLLQGGLSTGKTVTDNCAIVAKLPDQLISGSTLTPQAYCHVETPFLTQAQALGSYEIPKIGVRVSATFQSLPGPQVAGFQTVPNAAVVGSLGRNLSAGANQNVSVNLITPGSLYGDRMNEIDFRIGKIFRLGRMRAAPSIDLYNALNANPVTSETTQYAAFRQPTNILQARLLKLSLQLDF